MVVISRFSNCAYFDPENKERGIRFSTGRSAKDIADRETTRQWFEEFGNQVKQGYIS